MNIKEYIRENRLILDGSMGTLLQSKGLKSGENPEEWNLTHPEIICDIHRSYLDAGSNVVSTNTFGANLLNFSEVELEEIIAAAVLNARTAIRLSKGRQEKFVALDIGPLGKLLAPLGDFDFEEAVKVFAKTVEIGVKCGVDLIFLETFNDSLETKAALLAAKENSDFPVFVSNAYSEESKLMTGAEPKAMVALLEGMGADAIGMNCSFGPKALASVAREYLKYSSLPVILKPNAGLPRFKDGKTVFDVSPEEFAEDMAALASEGVSIIGGCCGTTPDYIEKTVKATENIAFSPVEKKSFTLVSSYTRAVEFGCAPVLIGERINPTGKKRFKEALKNNDIDYILKEGISQQEKGVHVLDVNVGLPEINEEEMLGKAVYELQTVTDLPLQIDTSNASAMEKALRRYNGKAMINSVNGKQESMDEIFPLAKKYGGVTVALTLDEGGIPQKAEGRIEIAKKILAEAEKYGINKKDIVFDPLALTVSSDSFAAVETLKAVKSIKEELGCHVSLGVSNVSYGLPCRDGINSAFFTLALSNGLSCAIMNPYSDEMLKAYYAFCALNGLDENCGKYIEFAEMLPKAVTATAKEARPVNEQYKSELQKAVIKGLKEQAGGLTRLLLETEEPLSIVQNEIIPALNTVGDGFERKTLYLPQLLMAAEAAKAAFEQIKLAMKNENTDSKNKVVLATVKGDIHDIGKNIVKLLLENYGFEVIDLGKDVPPEEIVRAAREQGVRLVGLSALMTTTVPAMEETIKQLKQAGLSCKTVVGGAVLNEDYAQKIGADKYAKDAMETVRYAMEIYA